MFQMSRKTLSENPVLVAVLTGHPLMPAGQPSELQSLKFCPRQTPARANRPTSTLGVHHRAGASGMFVCAWTMVPWQYQLCYTVSTVSSKIAICLESEVNRSAASQHMITIAQIYPDTTCTQNTRLAFMPRLPVEIRLRDLRSEPQRRQTLEGDKPRAAARDLLVILLCG